MVISACMHTSIAYAKVLIIVLIFRSLFKCFNNVIRRGSASYLCFVSMYKVFHERRCKFSQCEDKKNKEECVIGAVFLMKPKCMGFKEIQ